MNTYNITTSALNTEHAVQIKDSLTMYDIVYTYLQTSINKHGYILCPFHAEKTPSLYVWDDHFKCFGCGKSGDIISFVQDYFKLDFPSALSKLNTDFNLNLPIGEKPTLRQVRDAQERHEKIIAEREAKECNIAKLMCKFRAACDELKRLRQNFIDYKPSADSDVLHPLFSESLQKLSYYDYLSTDLSEQISRLEQPHKGII